MTFESQTPLTLVYHATQGGKREFSYGASFLFKRKTVCSNFSIKPPSGNYAFIKSFHQLYISICDLDPFHISIQLKSM